ncbi:MAG: hypothetical protein FJZ83_05640 [Chloroflexi bacterium]|nr:hypothetical protein [Chloroflexota bacterium]
MEDCGLDPAFYANRERDLGELLPWQHIDIGVSQSFLKKEYSNVWQGEETTDCRHEVCHACGLQGWHTACQQKLSQGKI